MYIEHLSCTSTPEEFGLLSSLNLRQFLFDNLGPILEEFGILIWIDFVHHFDAATVGIVDHFLTNVCAPTKQKMTSQSRNHITLEQR